jgi:predicted restriction endonuclease
MGNAAMNPAAQDAQLRQAAFDHVNRLPTIKGGVLSSDDVSNGLPLTKLHHAAFDANLIGIDPDFRIHVADRLLEIHDGPFLEIGLKQIAGTRIELPRRREDPHRLLFPQSDRLPRGAPLSRFAFVSAKV